jgi:hypothetical protein
VLKDIEATNPAIMKSTAESYPGGAAALELEGDASTDGRDTILRIKNLDRAIAQMDEQASATSEAGDK